MTYQDSQNDRPGMPMTMPSLAKECRPWHTRKMSTCGMPMTCQASQNSTHDIVPSARPNDMVQDLGKCRHGIADGHGPSLRKNVDHGMSMTCQ
ncbi:hypothetical protein DVH24_007898 [Malus domestica]|uniref:Uncharacterized protein n=1 Tax=Malus domestica TaxID=3750 RepID=A0A498KP81_MALDO|nr:hypothetical protein DVH24_007898 [Malus domestica]